MLPKNIQITALMAVLAVFMAIFVLNLAANPQLFDLVLPAIIAVVAAIWIITSLEQQQRQ